MPWEAIATTRSRYHSYGEIVCNERVALFDSLATACCIPDNLYLYLAWYIKKYKKF